jgi:hypothetical protein
VQRTGGVDLICYNCVNQEASSQQWQTYLHHIFYIMAARRPAKPPTLSITNYVPNAQPSLEDGSKKPERWGKKPLPWRLPCIHLKIGACRSRVDCPMHQLPTFAKTQGRRDGTGDGPDGSSPESLSCSGAGILTERSCDKVLRPHLTTESLICYSTSHDQPRSYKKRGLKLLVLLPPAQHTDPLASTYLNGLFLPPRQLSDPHLTLAYSPPQSISSP